ncbi:SDR family oxidoreductase [Paenibacillus sp.]|uniref:SDR family oxidoreductase n=1 Tax=Paenibacillus sp. TaxID=58172 RepID=UPI002D422E0D|nr:SDR family oxidoreductase [Paenibacillus sp.]HZG55619.1 SDR family oxidoreductase [Paenibacillus sp.]
MNGNENGNAHGNKPLEGRIAVVAGATRGAGRGIAVKLGEAGATVYVTGRTTRETRSDVDRSETIEETAELVTAAGGHGIAVRTDHTEEAQVQALFERVEREQGGRLDLLVNDVWGCERYIDFGRKFWEQPLSNALVMQDRAVRAHLITSYYGVPLLVNNKGGLVIEITDGMNYDFRGSVGYSLAKTANIHLAQALACELKPYGVAAVSLTPGFLRSEQMLAHFGVTEQTWRQAPDPHFRACSETPAYIGAAVVALASDPDILSKSGQAFSTWRCAEEYGIRDADGSQPHWGNYYAGIGGGNQQS